MSYMAYTTFIFCFLAIWAVNGMPKGKGDKNGEKGDDDVICRDMHTDCKAYKNTTYMCNDVRFGEIECKKTCGLCFSSDDSDIIIKPGETTCTIETSSGPVKYAVGMLFTFGCMSYMCFESGEYGGTDIHCGKFELPSSCGWKPPACNKCCPVPHCPDGIEIPYPRGYIEH